MTRERAKELLTVITAFANGETVECKSTNGSSLNWKVGDVFGFDDGYEYRIKPKSVTITREDLQLAVCGATRFTLCETEAIINAVASKLGL